MKKIFKSLILLITYFIGQTVAHAHGAHGVETSLTHQFTQPQHLVELFVIGTLLGLFFVLRKARQTTKKCHRDV